MIKMSKIADLLIEKSDKLTNKALQELSTNYTFNDYHAFKFCLSDKIMDMIIDDYTIEQIDMFIEFDGSLVMDYDGSIIGKIENKEVF